MRHAPSPTMRYNATRDPMAVIQKYSSCSQNFAKSVHGQIPVRKLCIVYPNTNARMNELQIQHKISRGSRKQSSSMDFFFFWCHFVSDLSEVDLVKRGWGLLPPIHLCVRFDGKIIMGLCHVCMCGIWVSTRGHSHRESSTASHLWIVCVGMFRRICFGSENHRTYFRAMVGLQHRIQDFKRRRRRKSYLHCMGDASPCGAYCAPILCGRMDAHQTILQYPRGLGISSPRAL